MLTGGRLSAQTKSTLVNAYDDHLSETFFSISALKLAEIAKVPARQVLKCSKIQDKKECCKYKDDRWYYQDAPNCVPGDFSSGNVCEPERWVNYKDGDKAEMCGKEPLAMLSNFGAAGAWKGIDGLYGERVANYGLDGTCMSSSKMDDPWFQLNLGVKVDISSIHLHNRKDCCGTENDGFSVYLDGKLCAKDINTRTNVISRVPCRGYGQVLKVVIPEKSRVLSFCEIEIHVNQGADKDGFYPRNTIAEERALKHVLKLFALVPEFHATNKHVATPNVRPVAKEQPSQGRKKKSVVVLFLEGGADSFNIVVPYPCPKDQNGQTTSCPCEKPPSAEDDPTLAPRRLTGGVSCAATPSCVPVSTKAWCKKHANALKVGYTSVAGSAQSSNSRPPGCYLERGTGSDSVLQFNDFKESVAGNKNWDNVRLCGGYQDLGIGYCRDGYYAGISTLGATLKTCRELCDKEDKCKFFSLEKNTCKRYSGDINSCTPLDGFTHRTYQKLKLAAGTRRVTRNKGESRERRAITPVEHDYYAEYASICGVDVSLKEGELHELTMPAGSKQPCPSFGLHPSL